MSKWPTGSAYVGNSINYLLCLPAPFPRGLYIDLEGSNTLLSLTLSMNINRLSMFSHLYRTLFNCLSTCPGSLVGTTALCMVVGWCCAIAVSAWCSTHQLTGCKCTRNRFYAPLGHQNNIYMGIYGYMQPYLYIFTCMYRLQINICIILHLLACLFVFECFYILRYICI